MSSWIGTTNFRKMKPTLKHRPAIWENMLGTVYAMNDNAQVKYFDYDWDAAQAFAGVAEDGRDVRVFNAPQRTANLRKGQTVVYVIRGKYLK